MEYITWIIKVTISKSRLLDDAQYLINQFPWGRNLSQDLCCKMLPKQFLDTKILKPLL